MDWPSGLAERWCHVKLKHWVFTGLTIIAVLYIWHVMVTHGGKAGFMSGLGFGKAA